MTLSRTEPQQPQNPPESFELSFKTPGRSLRELSRRVVGGRGDGTSPTSSSTDESDRDNEGNDDGDDLRRTDMPPPATAQPVVQRWNKPRGNVGRFGFACFSFIIAGLNDAAVGVCLPPFALLTQFFCSPFLKSLRDRGGIPDSRTFANEFIWIHARL